MTKLTPEQMEKLQINTIIDQSSDIVPGTGIAYCEGLHSIQEFTLRKGLYGFVPESMIGLSCKSNPTIVTRALVLRCHTEPEGKRVRLLLLNTLEMN